MDRIDLLRVFSRVVETRSFTRAAADLGVSRSLVSMAIQSLETRHGARLLNRSTRHVVPTEEGDLLYQRSQPLISDMEEIDGLFSTTGEAAEGRVRVEAPCGIGRLIIAPALPELLAQHSGLRIEFGSSDRIQDMISERIDLALRVGEMSDSSLVARRIGEIEFINVASPGYLARHGTPRRAQDLPLHMEVSFISPPTCRPLEWHWQEGSRGKRFSMQSQVIAGTAEMVIACAVAGMGIIRTPSYEVAAQLESGELVAILPKFRIPPMPVSLVWPHRRYMSQRVRVVSDWLAALMGKVLVPSCTALPEKGRCRQVPD